MTKQSSSKKIVSGGLAALAAVIVIVLALVQMVTGIDLGLFDVEETSNTVSSTMLEGEWHQLYFTYPQEELTWTGGLDETLAADISQAQTSIDIAAYDFDLQTVTDALIQAHQRGVAVRMVTDTDNMDLDQPQDLIDAGIPVVEDDRSAIMHNKFVVIDGTATWLGSWNFTDNGTYRNDNNAIRIISPELAVNYTAEFDEMFVDGAFGPTSPAETPHRRITIQGTLIESYFAPEDEVMNRLLEVVSRAEESIRFLAFSFTDDELGAAMRTRARAGVLVEGVFESRGSDTEYSEFPAMQKADLQVWKDGNSAIMHHKVIIIDDSTVVLGSYNFSNNADNSNDENLLIIYNREIASQFQEEFNRVLSQARP